MSGRGLVGCFGRQGKDNILLEHGHGIALLLLYPDYSFSSLRFEPAQGGTAMYHCGL